MLKMTTIDYESVHGRSDLSPNISALFDEGLKILVKDVLQLPLNNAIPLAIYHHAGVSTWHQFMYIDECDIKEATYLDERGKMKYLSRFEQKLLRWLIGYVRESIDSNQFGSEQPSFYNKEGFTKYTQHRRKMTEFMANYKKTNFSEHRKKIDKVPSNIVIETSSDSSMEQKVPLSSKSLVEKQDPIKKSSHHRSSTGSKRSKNSFRTKCKSSDKTIQNIVDLADELKASNHRPKSYKTLRKPSLSPSRPRSLRSQ